MRTARKICKPTATPRVKLNIIKQSLGMEAQLSPSAGLRLQLKREAHPLLEMKFRKAIMRAMGMMPPKKKAIPNTSLFLATVV